jgi:hypothetical protein
MSMLEANLYVFRHELRNHKALAEKITSDHRREIEEMQQHYCRLIKEKDESIEILHSAHEKERLELKAQLEQTMPWKEPTAANEESVGQEMDALQCEINRIADAYAKALSQDTAVKKQVHAQPRSGGPRSRFILPYLTVMFGALVSEGFNHRVPALVRECLLTCLLKRIVPYDTEGWNLPTCST